MGRLVVLDNTILSNLAQVGRTDLIGRLWTENVCATTAVMEEHLAGVKSGILPEGSWTGLLVIELTKDENGIRKALPSRLGMGEKSCIAVAHHRNGVLVTDDFDARKVAIRMGIPTTGTVGVLALCTKQEVISLEEGNHLLKLMIDHGYRAPVEKLDALVKS